MNIYYFLLIILKGVIVMEEQRTFVANRHRGRIVYVPISFISLLFGGRLLDDDGGQYIEVPVIEGIPADAELVMIMACPERDAIGLKYLHKSFEETIEGNMFPEVPCREITFKKVKVEKDPNNGG